MSLELIPGRFMQYSITDKERTIGFQVSALTVANFHNLRTQIAEEKLALEFTPNDVLKYTQQEAFKAGQIAVLDYLLSEIEVATTQE